VPACTASKHSVGDQDGLHIYTHVAFRPAVAQVDKATDRHISTGTLDGDARSPFTNNLVACERCTPHLGHVALEEPVAHEGGGALVPQRASAVVSSVALVDGPTLERGRGALARVDCPALAANFIAVLWVVQRS